MPVVERNISYFFPTSKASRLEAIEQARANGQQWVSTAIVDGRELMKLCEIITTDRNGYIHINGNNVGKARPSYPKGRIPYAGKE